MDGPPGAREGPGRPVPGRPLSPGWTPSPRADGRTAPGLLTKLGSGLESDTAGQPREEVREGQVLFQEPRKGSE